MEDTYEITEVNKTTFEYTTLENVKYQITFEPSEKLFTDACVNCHRIYEIVWRCERLDACRDSKSGKTLVEIVKGFLANDFNDAVLYRVYNEEEPQSDGTIKKRGHLRDLLFNKLISNYIDSDFKKLCNDPFIANPEEKLCLIVDINSPNYSISVDDINKHCIPCQEASQTNC